MTRTRTRTPAVVVEAIDASLDAARPPPIAAWFCDNLFFLTMAKRTATVTVTKPTRPDTRWSVIAAIAAIASLTGVGAPAACSTQKAPKGGLMLVLTQDGTLAIDRLRIEVVSNDVTIKRSDYRVPAETDLPTSLAIASNGNPDASVRISVVAWQGNVARDRRDYLVERVPTQRVAQLTVTLTARCSGLVFVEGDAAKSRCSEGETCIESPGTCGTGRVDASTLPTASGDLPSVGGGVDGGAVPDARVEASSVDGGPVDDYATAVLTDGPVAYFRLEETSGASCKNEIAGSPATCILPSANVTLGVPGSGGARKAVRLDETSTQIAMFSATPYAGEDAFTIEAWLAIDPVVPGGSVFGNEDFVIDHRTGQFLYLDPTNNFRTETWTDGGILFYTQSKAPATPQAWHHIAYGYSPATRKDFMYVDGALATGSRLSPDTRVAPKAALAWTGSKFVLDDVAIYAKELMPERIAAHYTAR